MNLLTIESSPRGERSVSRTVARAFVDAFAERTPSLAVDTLDVWAEALPEFDGAAIGAKYKGAAGEPMAGSEAAVWERIGSLAERFRRADRIVLGVPMWNFGMPYKLKQLIDLVSQRNLLFTFDGTRYGPKLDVPRACAIYARGQSGAEDGGTPASAYDHQSAYLEFWLRFIGVRDVVSLVVDHTWSDEKDTVTARGVAAARELARTF